MQQVLIVDDDRSLCHMLAQAVERSGYKSVLAYTLKDGLKSARTAPIAGVFLDLGLPDGNGLDELDEILNTPSTPEVIVITGKGDAAGAESALKNGAWEFLEKPFSLQYALTILSRALEYRRGRQQKDRIRTVSRENIVGESPQLLNCIDELGLIAPLEAKVLIRGETGTGKELFARAVHANSPRRNENFAVVDCTTLNSTLAESILFGHVRGAFTGAYYDKQGQVGLADRGTLFLDEIGDLPLGVQKKFLRVLEDGEYLPVGSTTKSSSDFRLVAATHRDLERMVAEGKFREDLYFRLSTHQLHLPPLRNRNGDIDVLTFHFLGTICRQKGMGHKKIDSESMDYLRKYTWPGNVRELHNALESAIDSGQHQTSLCIKNLPTDLRIAVIRDRLQNNPLQGKEHANSGPKIDQAAPPEANTPLPVWKVYREQGLNELEKQYFTLLANQCAGDVHRLAEAAGISLSRGYALIKKHALR